MYDVAQSVGLRSIGLPVCELRGLTVGTQHEPFALFSCTSACWLSGIFLEARAIDGGANQVFSRTDPVTASLYAIVMLKVEIISGQTVIKHGKNGMAKSQWKKIQYMYQKS